MGLFNKKTQWILFGQLPIANIGLLLISTFGHTVGNLPIWPFNTNAQIRQGGGRINTRR